MALKTWWLFVVAVFLIAATPGPNMLHVTVQSVRHGPRRTLAAMAGLMTAVLACLFASALGLGALLQASPRLFVALRYLGAGYLIWIGIKAWRPARSGDRQDEPVPVRRGWRARYGAGLATGLANPKLILFAAAFFPQFLDPRRPFWPQLGVLIATFAAIEGFWYAVYAASGRSLAAWLARPRRRRLFDRATGTLFIAFGAALLFGRIG